MIENTVGSAFSLRSVPEIVFGAGRARAIATDAAEIGQADKLVALITDSALMELGLAAPILDALAHGVSNGVAPRRWAS